MNSKECLSHLLEVRTFTNISNSFKHEIPLLLVQLQRGDLKLKVCALGVNLTGISGIGLQETQ